MDVSISTTNQYIARLNLPKASCDELSYCNATPEDLKAFLDSLPHSNAAELCHRLYRLLPELAGLKAPPGRKIALLDLVKPEAMECVQRLTWNLAITPTSAKTLSLAIAMLRNLAEGYKSIIVSVLQSPAAPPNLLISACHSAVAVLHQILMDCWECYVPPPPNIWLEIHTVFAIARLKNLEKVPIHRQQTNLTVESSIYSAYVVPLMMACADPARYTPQDLRQMEHFLQLTAHLVEFSDKPAEGIFAVDPQADSGPQYSFKMAADNSELFRIKTYRLVRYIEEKLSTATLAGMSERLAKDLCKHWSSEIQRTEDPQADDTELTIVFGLSHIHRTLTGSKNLESYLDSLKPRRSDPTSQFELLEDYPADHRDSFIQKRPDVQAIAFRAPTRPPSADAKLHQPTATQPPLRQYQAVRKNRSSHGARVEFNAPTETLTAGEMVLLSAEADNQWRIGLVRWTQVTRQLNRMLGIELLDGHAHTCAVSQVTATSQGNEQFYPGLMATIDDEQHIILPNLAFRPYSTARLYAATGNGIIQLHSCVESTYHIAIFKMAALSQ